MSPFPPASCLLALGLCWVSLALWGDETSPCLPQLSCVQSLNFGKLQVGPQGGHIQLSLEDTRNQTGELRSSGIAHMAVFQLFGPPNTPFSIEVENPQVPLFSDEQKLVLQNFNCSYLQWEGQLDGSGRAEIKVGGSLDTGLDPRPGLYQSQDLRLKVQFPGQKALYAPFTAQAQLLSLLCISNDGPMDFGGLLSRGAPGRVKLDPEGHLQSLDSGGPIRASGKPRAARFTLRSLKGTAYCIHLPDQIQLQGPRETMQVHHFTLDVPKSGILCKRELTFNVGATLVVPATPQPGTYQGLFHITVSYY